MGESDTCSYGADAKELLPYIAAHISLSFLYTPCSLTDSVMARKLSGLASRCPDLGCSFKQFCLSSDYPTGTVALQEKRSVTRP